MNSQEKRVIDVLGSISASHRDSFWSVTPDNGRLLRVLAEGIGAKTIVEIGMSSGGSTLWLALAARNSGGRIITHEIDERRIPVAREHCLCAVAEAREIEPGLTMSTFAPMVQHIPPVMRDRVLKALAQAGLAAARRRMSSA